MSDMTNDRYDDLGTKDDSGKPPLDLIPWDAVLGAARVFDFGRQKYGAYNWRGLSKSRLFAAMVRHGVAWLEGEDVDAETNEPHLYHAVCCALMLASKHGVDDRPHLKGAGPAVIEEELLTAEEDDARLFHAELEPDEESFVQHETARQEAFDRAAEARKHAFARQHKLAQHVATEEGGLGS